MTQYNRPQEPRTLRPEARMLPQNIPAELAILGCIIIDPGLIALVGDTLRAEHFYRNTHQMIYSAMMHLYEQQEPPDQHAVANVLRQRGQLETIGGYTYFNNLVQESVSTSSIERYARDVIRESILRGALQVSGQIADTAWNAGDRPAQEILEEAEGLVYDLSRRECIASNEAESIVDAFDNWYDAFDSAPSSPGAVIGVTSGLRDLDRLTGGFQNSDLIILCGRPGTGKSAFMTSVGRAAAQASQGVFISSLEMSKGQLVERLVSMETGIDLHRLHLRRVTEEERALVIDARERISALPIYIDDTPGLSILQLRSKLRREMARHQIRFVIIDYLQLLIATVDGKRISNRYEEVSEVARSLKNLAKAFNIPVLALSQLSRAVEGRQVKVPQLSDLRESGEIEQAADVVFAIYRDELYAGVDPETGQSASNRAGTVDLLCLKQRSGPTGEVSCGFDKTQTRYYDLERQITDADIEQEERAQDGYNE